MALVCSSLAFLVAIACREQPQIAIPVPAPAAVSAPVSQPAFPVAAKQIAILGKPSALQQLLLQQSGAAAPLPAAVAQPSDPLAPAAGVQLQARPAVVDYSYGRPRFGWAPASPDRPDVFGSSAMPIAQTPLDAKWRRATAGTALPAQLPVAGQSYSAMQKLELVNSWVNGRIRFADDIRATGVADRWSGAAETLAKGQGDCEDYAITKLQILKAMGFSADDLYLSVVKDLVRRADHAVLVVRVDGRFVVLDNNVNRVLDTQEVGDYRPIFSYAASGKAWFHGYRQPVQLASAAR